MKDLCSYQTVRPTRPRSAPPDYPFTLGRLTNNAALIPPEADQRRSKISPLSTSETFTQRRVWRIAAGSPHANGSVKEASKKHENRKQIHQVALMVFPSDTHTKEVRAYFGPLRALFRWSIAHGLKRSPLVHLGCVHFAI